MGVIVSNSISQSGSTISGDTVQIVITTNPGYAPDDPLLSEDNGEGCTWPSPSLVDFA